MILFLFLEVSLCCPGGFISHGESYNPFSHDADNAMVNHSVGFFRV